jgi:hypothetical protein
MSYGFLGDFLNGSVSARSADQPRRNLMPRVSTLTPSSLAHCDSVCDRPLNSMTKLFDLLLACSMRSAQRQFAFEYGPLKSMRSTECFGDGRGPMSAKNVSNFFHDGSTVTPLSPYPIYDLWFGLVHLVHIWLHALCSGVFVIPCVVRSRMRFLRNSHMHVSFFNFSKFPVNENTVFPQTQRHSHRPCSDRAATVREPNVLPMRFMMGFPFMSENYQHSLA